MQRRNPVCRGPLAAAVLVLAGLAWPSLAAAADIQWGTTPGTYAVTFLYESWTAQPSAATAFLDNREQLTGADAIASAQTSGIDAVPMPSCSPPCTGMTAEASARYEDGGLTFTAFSHAYGNFDQTYTIDEPPVRIEGYADGNILKAEASAGVLDSLTITSPVTIHLEGRLTGENTFQSASDSALYESELPDAYFGIGASSASLVVNLRTGPPYYYYYDIQVANLNAPTGTPHVAHDVPLDGSVTVLSPDVYDLQVQLRTNTRVGTVNGPNLAVQNMISDFSHTAAFRLVADDPSAVTSGSGRLTFNGVPEPSQAALEAVAGLALALRAGAARRRGSERRVAAR